MGYVFEGCRDIIEGEGSINRRFPQSRGFPECRASVPGPIKSGDLSVTL